MAGTIILLSYVAIAVAAWLIYRGNLNYIPSDPSVFYGGTPSPPTFTLFPFHLGSYPLGQTGEFGFNVFEGLVKGTPWDLLLFSGIIVPSALLGLFIGTLSGGLRGFIDDALMTVTDVVLSVPPFVIALLVFVAIIPGLPPLEIPFVFAFSMILISWAPYARLVRSRARRVAAMPFVESAVAGGASKWRVLFRHVMPNSTSPIMGQIPITFSTLVTLMIIIPYAGIYASQEYITVVIFVPSSHFPEWTWIMVNGMLGWHVINSAWWGYFFPFLWILIFGLGLLFFCDGFADILQSHR
jgi:peptide/nickel transport system permease protein